MTIIGIDFETANSQRNSACQIGIAVLEDGQLVDSFTSLLLPPGPFSPFCVEVHGITAARVRGAPTLAALWPRIRHHFTAGHRLVAHNAPFDHAVLRASLAHHGVAPPTLTFDCTLALARRHLPTLPNHRLPTVCAALGLTLTHHHDARADALAAAQIAWALAQRGAPA